MSSQGKPWAASFWIAASQRSPLPIACSKIVGFEVSPVTDNSAM